MPIPHLSHKIHSPNNWKNRKEKKSRPARKKIKPKKVLNKKRKSTPKIFDIIRTPKNKKNPFNLKTFKKTLQLKREKFHTLIIVSENSLPSNSQSNTLHEQL